MGYATAGASEVSHAGAKRVCTRKPAMTAWLRANGNAERAFFIRAMWHDPLSWRVYVGILLCALPKGIEPRVRRAAKLLFYRAKGLC